MWHYEYFIYQQGCNSKPCQQMTDLIERNLLNRLQKNIRQQV
jgi:hypothetical protein